MLRGNGGNFIFTYFFNVNCLKMDLDLFIFYCQYIADACYILDVQNVLIEGSKEEKKE